MRGLTSTEQLVIHCVMKNEDPHDDWTLNVLLRRGLLSVKTITCASPFCPGHNWIDVTSVGKMVLGFMRSLE